MEQLNVAGIFVIVSVWPRVESVSCVKTASMRCLDFSTRCSQVTAALLDNWMAAIFVLRIDSALSVAL